MIDLKKPVVQGKKALEIAMRDVLDGMEEAALYVGFEGNPCAFEILSIEPPPKPRQKVERASVTPIQRQTAASVSDYLIARESTKKRA